MENAIQVPVRVAKTLLNALQGGVVPRTGLGYITVGRKDEIEALLHDVATISSGGASFRFIVGKYGAGKSFLLQTLRNYAMEHGFVVVDADLSPERRLVGYKGEGLATYRELMKNLSTKTMPDGGALSLLLSKWVDALRIEIMTEEGIPVESPRLNNLVTEKIQQTIVELETIVHGFDFGRVIALYWHATVTEDEALKSKTLQWLRGEYATKTAAKEALGIGVIIDDENWYDYLKLFSFFVIKAGYQGMIMIIDELVNLSQIPMMATRQKNYEKILTIYNDIMQGKAQHLGVIMGGTPESIEDERRGVFSYGALKSRLENSKFSDAQIRDLFAPIIKLKALSPEELYVLMQKLTRMHALVYQYEPRLNDTSLQHFIETQFSRIGAQTHITPREMIRDFIAIMNIMWQNPDSTLEAILCSSGFDTATGQQNDEAIDPQFAGFEV